LFHNGSHSFIQQYGTGDLYIDNTIDDKSIFFRTDDGSGGVTTYLSIRGDEGQMRANKQLRMQDNVQLQVGSSGDAQFFHNTADTYLQNSTGHLYIQNTADDRDIIVSSDDGSGGITPYITLDGGTGDLLLTPPTRTEIQGNLVVEGDLTAQNYIVSSSVTYMTQSFSSGSTIFGDSTSDTHQFTGSLNANSSTGSFGELRLPPTGKLIFDQSGTDGSGTYIAESQSDVVDHYVGGTLMLRIEESGTDYVQVFDNTRLSIGTGKDLQLYHAGNVNYIRTITQDQDLHFNVNDGGSTITALKIDSSEIGNVHLPNWNQALKVGASGNILLYHSSTAAKFVNITGDMEIENQADDKDIILKSDDGSGGTTAYLTLDGSEARLYANLGIRVPDSKTVDVGGAGDGQFFHNGTNTFLTNSTGNFYIDQYADDGDLIFRCDDGSGGNTPYITLDGSSTQTLFHQNTRLQADNKSLSVGANNDLRMIHATHSYLQNTSTSLLVIQNTGVDQDISFMANDNGSNNHVMRIKGANGRVGIGTTSPESKLNIVDSGETIIKLYASTASTRSGIWFTNGSYSYGTNIGTDNKFHITGNINSEGELVTVDSSGNVGIGTTTPTNLMHINGSDGNGVSLRLQGDASYGATIRYSRGTSYNWNAGVGGASSSISNIPSSFWGVEDQSQSNAVRLAIAHTTGNVGIGTTSPASKLDLGGSTSGQRLTFSNTGVNTTNGARTQAEIGYKTNSYSGAAVIKILTETQYDDSMALAFHTGTSAAESMRIDSSQNVGIGTASPATTLHVSSSGVNGILIDKDGADNTISSRLLFREADSTIALYNTGDTFSFRTGATVDSTSGTQRFYVNTSGASVVGNLNVTGNSFMNYGLVVNETANDADFRVEGTSDAHLLLTDAANNRVGINTSGPSAKLHINQDASEGAFLVQGGGGGQYIGRFQRDVGGSSYVDIHAGSDDPQITFTTTAAARQFSIGVDSSGHKLLISENSSVGTNDRFTIDDSGFVGIGTTSPAGPLTIANANNGSWNDGLIIDDPSGWAATVYKRSNSPKMFTGLYSGNDNYIWMSAGYDNTGTTITAPRTDAVLMSRPGTDDLQIYLDTHFGGDVGIGTTSPQRKLHVSTGNTDIAARFENTTSNGTVMELLASGDSSTLYFQTDHIYGSGNLHLGGGTNQNIYRGSSHTFQVGSGNTTNITLNSNYLLFAQPTRIQFANDQRIFDNGSGGLKIGAASHELELYSGGTDPINFITGGISGTTQMKIDSDGNLKLSAGNGISVYNSNTSLGGYVLHPGGGQYRTSANTHTGAIEIKVPAIYADMVTFWVDIFDYVSNESISYQISGYVYQTPSSGGNEWVNVSATQISNNTNYERAVRFGHDGTNHLVYIGELTDTWSYPQITVRDVTVGFGSSIDHWSDGWAIDFEASAFANLDETITNTLVQAGKIKMADGAGQFWHNTTSTRDKIRVWNNSAYAIGMQSGFTFGGSQSDYAMTFQMDNDADRGFWFGDSSHTNAQGAAFITTLGKMTLAHSLRLGYGESDTTVPGASYRLDVDGNSLVTGTMYASTIQTDSGNLNLSGGGWGMNFYIDTDANSADNYNFYSDNALRHILGGDGNVTFGKTSNPTLSIMNTATAAGSGPTLEFGHDQGGGARAGAISTYLSDGSTANRTALLRFWHTQAGADILKMQMGDNYVRQYQKADASDYLETIVNDDHVEFHVASGNYVKISTDSGYLHIGPQNTSHCHYTTDRANHWFNQMIYVNGGVVSSYNADLYLRRSGDSADQIQIQASAQNFIIDATTRMRLTSAGLDVLNNIYFGTGNVWQLDQGSWTAGSANQANIMLSGASGTFGIHSNSGNADLLVDGSIRSLADVVAYYSDIRLKHKLEPITSALEKVQSLEGFTYESNELAKELGYNEDYDNLTGKRKVGVSAQQVQEILPEAVTLAPFDTRKNEDGTIESISGEDYLTVKYEKMVPLLIESIKELKGIVETQQTTIEKQQQQITKLEEKSNG